MIKPSDMKRLMAEYRRMRNKARWTDRHAEFQEYDDVLVKVTGMAALARLEKPSGSDASDWVELRDLTYQTVLRFVSAGEQDSSGSHND